MAWTFYQLTMRKTSLFMLVLCSIASACVRNDQHVAGTSNLVEDGAAQTAVEMQFEPTDDEISAIRMHLLAEQEREQPNDPAPATFKAASIDLNRDGKNELLVRLEGRYYCGSGGCTLRVYRLEAGALAEISRTTITRLPVGITHQRDGGWSALTVGIGGGGMPDGRALLRYHGKRYPRNPTVAPVVTTKQAGIAVLDIDSPDYSLVGP